MPAAESEDDAEPIAARRSRVFNPALAQCLAVLAPLAIYAALALAYFGTRSSWTSNYFGGGEADAFAYMWFLNWWPFALAHHLNPLVTHYMWYPDGENLTWAASVPFAALLGAPATLTLGPVFTYNALTVSAPPLAAWTGFLLARSITRDWSASLVAGYLFGFSSYELSKIIGQLNLNLIWLLPLFALLCLARVRQDVGRWTFILLMTALMIGQLGLATEIFVTAAGFGALAWAVFWLAAEPEMRHSLRRLAGEALAAGGLTVVLTLPFFISLWRGLADTPSQFNSPVDFSADPANYIIPTVVTWIGNVAAAPYALRFAGNPVEQSAYLGLPGLAILALYARDAAANRYAVALLALIGLLFVLSLGPALHLDSPNPGIALPWAVTAHIPVIRSLLPTRFPLYLDLGFSLAAALWLASPGSRQARLARFALALIACAALLPNPATFPWAPMPSNPFFTKTNIAATLGRLPNVLIMPFGANGAGAAYQFESGMSFTQSGGYLGYVPHHEAVQQVVDDLVNDIDEPFFKQLFARFCQTHKLNDILITPDAPSQITGAITALHWPQQIQDGITIIHIPAQ